MFSDTHFVYSGLAFIYLYMQVSATFFLSTGSSHLMVKDPVECDSEGKEVE